MYARLTRWNKVIKSLFDVNDLITSQRFTRILYAEVVLQASRGEIQLYDEITISIDDLLLSEDGIGEGRSEVVRCVI